MKRTLIKGSAIALFLGILFGALLAAALPAGAQQSIQQIPVWTGKAYSWFTVGKSFTLANGVIDVLPQPVKSRSYDVQLTPNAAGAFPLPAGASNVIVFRNGLRQHRTVDYDIANGVITPSEAWPADHQVTADYDQ